MLVQPLSPPVLLRNFAFVEVKAFGDLVVAASSIRQLPPASQARCRLVIGPYLSDLSQALAPPCPVELLPIADRSVPALFNVKKCGPWAALRSAISLRSALTEAAPEATLVTERRTVRECFITGHRPALAIPCADNVYLAFEAFMIQHLGLPNSAQSSTGLPLAAAPKTDSPRPRRIALCPFSRVAAKNIPPETVVALARECEQAGFQAELLLLEGECFEHPNALPARIIQRRFDALADALTGYAAVISADSLPAHLAEYRATPAFIASPIENRYWLPRRAFQGDHWGLFTDHDQMMTRLQRFLELARS